MSKARLYVGNIPFTATENDLREFFHGFELKEIRLITDRETGQPRGFGFVELRDERELVSAIAELNGLELMGRSLRISEAIEKPRTERPRNDRPRGGKRDSRLRDDNNDEYMNAWRNGR